MAKLPKNKDKRGHIHPLSHITKQLVDIFQSMGFSVVLGPDVETEYYNFDALNIPPNHPARDMWDTFWLKGGQLLRTHTSPMQVRFMEKNNPPFAIVVPGRVYRYEATDATHEVQFNQLEGLMIGKDITLANLKGVLAAFFKKLFGKEIEIRFRPSFFPFVEPGLEVDMKWGEAWLEMAGAGMVHPQVLKNVKISPREWQGFAFGVGIDRVAMIKYKIDDIRLFYGNDMRFLRQF
jgi:phenylalanyl-tRNA synthetase alpha chain